MSALVKTYLVLAWVIAAAGAFAALLLLAASQALGAAGIVLAATFVGWLLLFTSARALQLLQEIRDAALRSAEAAEDDR